MFNEHRSALNKMAIDPTRSEFATVWLHRPESQAEQGEHIRMLFPSTSKLHKKTGTRRNIHFPNCANNSRPLHNFVRLPKCRP